MKRREIFRWSTAAALTAALPGTSQAVRADAAVTTDASVQNRLHPPAEGTIDVAFLLSADAVVIDFAGPWEVFANVQIPGQAVELPFRLYTVAQTLDPIEATGGMTIVPDYTFDTCPTPRVLVIPAQSTRTHAALGWIRKTAHSADLTMSVCTGAFLLAETGLLSGKPATTHHGSYSEFAMKFPDITLRKGARYVESGKFASSGGLSSGIDLALRVVERYWGRVVALNTADVLEYQGQGWLDAGSNRAYTRRRGAEPRCPVCDMAVDKASAPSSLYRTRRYYFCMAEHKQGFDARPAAYLDAGI